MLHNYLLDLKKVKRVEELISEVDIKLKEMRETEKMLLVNALCEGIDAVYIATPIRSHYEQCKLFLNAGIPVLCEKSFTINQSQAIELCDLARHKNVFLMETKILSSFRFPSEI